MMKNYAISIIQNCLYMKRPLLTTKVNNQWSKRWANFANTLQQVEPKVANLRIHHIRQQPDNRENLLAWFVGTFQVLNLSGPDFNDIDIKEVVESTEESLEEDEEEALPDWR